MSYLDEIDDPRKPSNGTLHDFREILVILIALLLRDAQTRFGETRLGYLWALLEPISHLALIASVFAATHIGGTAPVGSNLIVYYFTGVLPYLLFSNTVFGVQHSLIANRPLLSRLMA